jgi:hypothetical protein
MGLTAVIVALCATVRRPDLVEMLVMISGAYHPGQSRPATQPPTRRIRHLWSQPTRKVSSDGAEHLPVVVAKIPRAAT